MRIRYQAGWGAMSRTKHIATGYLPIRSYPILNTKARYTFELPQIIGDQNQTLRSGVTRNHLVVRANRFTVFSEFGSQLAAMSRRLLIIVQDI